MIGSARNNGIHKTNRIVPKKQNTRSLVVIISPKCSEQPVVDVPSHCNKQSPHIHTLQRDCNIDHMHDLDHRNNRYSHKDQMDT